MLAHVPILAAHIAAAGVAGWAALSVLFVAGDAGSPGLSRVVGAACFLGLCATLWRRLDTLPGLGLIALISLAVTIALFRIPPRSDRNWAEDHARVASVEKEGARFAIDGFRRFRHPEGAAPTARWSRQSFDLAGLTGCDFIVVPFQGARYLAHTMVSFRFEEGPNLVVSIEARREPGEAYSVYRALFHQFEMIYVMGDEEDLIGSRLAIRGDDVFIYPIDGDLKLIRAFLADLLHEARALNDAPAWYHTLRSNCTTSLVKSYESATGRAVPFDLRLALPGRSAEFLFELGLLDRSATMAELNARHQAPKTGRPEPSEMAFSEWIRRPGE